MNSLKQFGNLSSLAISLLAVGWFGISCFKAGWNVHENLSFEPIVVIFLRGERARNDKP